MCERGSYELRLLASLKARLLRPELVPNAALFTPEARHKRVELKWHEFGKNRNKLREPNERKAYFTWRGHGHGHGHRAPRYWVRQCSGCPWYRRYRRCRWQANGFLVRGGRRGQRPRRRRTTGRTRHLSFIHNA
jgi:hypothetical protein